MPPDRDLIAAAITSVTLRVVELVGEHPAFRNAINYARAMARANAAILIRGPSGAGKELTARTIHQASGRTGPFITVECEGVTPDITESELFGHAAGAFPGAPAPRTGRLEEAARGTLYLRQIGALSPALQARLAETLTNGKFTPMGSEENVPCSARILAGSSVELRRMVAQGTFRADLMHRLGLVEVALPPLASRGEDIALLAGHFASQHAQENGLPLRTLDPSALALLRRYEWPENVRELDALVHRAVLLAPGNTISPAMLVLSDGTQMGRAQSSSPVATANTPVGALVGRSVGDVERELILKTLGHCGGNRTNASSILGISVRTMRNKLREFAQAGFQVG